MYRNQQRVVLQNSWQLLQNFSLTAEKAEAVAEFYGVFLKYIVYLLRSLREILSLSQRLKITLQSHPAAFERSRALFCSR